MSQVTVDEISRRLLGLLQVRFPLVREPFRTLGAESGVSGEEVIARIQVLKDEGLVRQIGPIFDSRRLGFQTTLAGMKVPEIRLENAALKIIAHPGISHGYLRNHEINLWITLAVSSETDIVTELHKLADAIPAEQVFNLPVVRFFKLKAVFGVEDIEESPTCALSINDQLSNVDKKIVNVIQTDLPLIQQPFDGFAEKLEMDTDDFLTGCRSLLKRGIMRRFSAAVNHRRAGYGANAMVCWHAGPEQVESLGNRLAALKTVSHCYERKVNSFWRYNLFAMLHGLSEAECLNTAAQVAAKTGNADYVLLFSTREIKKQRVKYTVQD